MPASKRKSKFLRPVHFQALVFIILYFVLSIIVVAKSLLIPSIYVSFLGSFSFGVISVFIFLYLFSHEDFFHFFKNLDKFESKKEKGYLGSYVQYGKFLACILVSIIAGQIFLALTIRFLFPKSSNRYLIAFLVTFISTVIVVFFGKTFLRFLGINI
jgi:uncharacterized membrane protein YbhN (UPF0104 family)